MYGGNPFSEINSGHLLSPPVSGPPVSGPPVSGPPVSGPPVSGPPPFESFEFTILTVTEKDNSQIPSTIAE